MGPLADQRYSKLLTHRLASMLTGLPDSFHRFDLASTLSQFCFWLGSVAPSNSTSYINWLLKYNFISNYIINITLIIKFINFQCYINKLKALSV